MTLISPGNIRNSIITVAQQHKLDPFLIGAIVQVESSFDPWAVRYEDHYRWLFNPADFAKSLKITIATERVLQQTSWGLMQVMGAVARERGFKLPMPLLCFPEHSLDIGCKHLVPMIAKWGVSGALSAYNSGRPDTVAGRAYRQKVMAAHKRLTSDPSWVEAVQAAELSLLGEPPLEKEYRREPGPS